MMIDTIQLYISIQFSMTLPLIQIHGMNKKKKKKKRKNFCSRCLPKLGMDLD